MKALWNKLVNDALWMAFYLCLVLMLIEHEVFQRIDKFISTNMDN